MKLPRLLTTVFLAGAVLAGGVTRSPAFCAIRCFGDLAGRYAQIVNDVTAWVQVRAQKIASGARWSGVAVADKQAYALLEMKGALGSAEKAATERGASIGYQTANSHLTLINDDVINSTRTSLQEMGEGVGHLAARSGLDDQALSACLLGSERGIKASPVFAAQGYTPAEFCSDWKVLFSDPPATVRPKMWSEKLPNPNGDPGAIAEVGVAARVKGAGHVEIGADEVPGTPLYGAKVDLLTDTEMYQVGVSATTIKDKIVEDPTGLATAIKKASDAYPGRPYKFAFCNDNWTPDPSTLADLNAALDSVYGGAAHHVFTANDFLHIPLQ